MEGIINNMNMVDEVVMNNCKKKLVKVKFVMDKSGSMGSMGHEPVQSLNNFIEEQKKDGEFEFSLTLFSDNVVFSKVNVSSNNLEKFSNDDIIVDGMTALYDGIGETIDAETEDATEVIFVILTDGLENASRKYTKSKIRKMITAKEAKGWKFIFLGANQDSFAESRGLGIKAGVSCDYEFNQCGLNNIMRSVSDTVRHMRSQSFDPKPSTVEEEEDDVVGDLPTIHKSINFNAPPSISRNTSIFPRRLMTEGPNDVDHENCTFDNLIASQSHA